MEDGSWERRRCNLGRLNVRTPARANQNRVLRAPTLLPAHDEPPPQPLRPLPRAHSAPFGTSPRPLAPPAIAPIRRRKMQPTWANLVCPLISDESLYLRSVSDGRGRWRLDVKSLLLAAYGVPLLQMSRPSTVVHCPFISRPSSPSHRRCGAFHVHVLSSGVNQILVETLPRNGIVYRFPRDEPSLAGAATSACARSSGVYLSPSLDLPCPSPP
ncbi:hypothetical protein BV20DRAFT_45536 [Pilatotrama ljubarskyi]|nr:hypothetical protein BV20DRAFT_45536 [Pilatotrama ljubarskyi]